MRTADKNRFESLGRLFPRSLGDALKAFLIAGIPTTFVIAVLSTPDQVSKPVERRQVYSSAEGEVRVAVKTMIGSPSPAPAQSSSVQNVTRSSVSEVPLPVNADGSMGDATSSTVMAHEMPATPLSTVERILDQFEQPNFNSDQITILLDRLAMELSTSGVSSEQLKDVLSRVLLEIETSRGKWKNDAESGLVLQGVKNVLAHAYEVKEDGLLQPLQDTPVLSEQDYRDLDERVERDRRNHLAALAQSRVQELLGLVKNDPGSRYDAVIGSFMLADSSNLISLLRTNGSTSEFIAAKSSVMRLLQDMIADYRFRTGQEDQVKRLEAFLNEIQAIV